MLNRYIASDFNVCTHLPFPRISGPKFKLIVDPKITPLAEHVPTLVPWHFREKFMAWLEAFCRMGVLEEVPANSPVEWMSRMVTPSKKNGDPRPMVDLSDLNKAYKRQTNHTKSLYHLASEVPKNIKKTCFLAWNGCHSLELEK